MAFSPFYIFFGLDNNFSILDYKIIIYMIKKLIAV